MRPRHHGRGVPPAQHKEWRCQETLYGVSIQSTVCAVLPRNRWRATQDRLAYSSLVLARVRHQRNEERNTLRRRSRADCRTNGLRMSKTQEFKPATMNHSSMRKLSSQMSCCARAPATTGSRRRHHSYIHPPRAALAHLCANIWFPWKSKQRKQWPSKKDQAGSRLLYCRGVAPKGRRTRQASLPSQCHSRVPMAHARVLEPLSLSSRKVSKVCKTTATGIAA